MPLGTGLTTIAPGLGWALDQFPTRPVWLPTDVSSQMRVRMTAPG